MPESLLNSSRLRFTKPGASIRGVGRIMNADPTRDYGSDKMLNDGDGL